MDTFLPHKTNVSIINNHSNNRKKLIESPQLTGAIFQRTQAIQRHMGLLIIQRTNIFSTSSLIILVVILSLSQKQIVKITSLGLGLMLAISRLRISSA